MLIKLLANQIAENWETLQPAILGSLNPAVSMDQVKLEALYENLIADKVQCWSIVRRASKAQIEIMAFMTTTIIEDPGTGGLSLLIYSLFGIRPLHEDIDLWLDSCVGLRKYAAAHDCEKIVGYTNSSSVLQTVQEHLGGQAEFTFFSITL